MSRRETPIGLWRTYPRIAIGGAAFLIALAVSQSLIVAAVFALVIASQTKKDWIDAFSTTPSGYLDRTSEALTEAAAPSSPDLVPPERLEAEDAEEERWSVAAPPTSPETREASGKRYGIAVPLRKPVDVPRR